jgi:hypothetical protein
MFLNKIKLVGFCLLGMGLYSFSFANLNFVISETDLGVLVEGTGTVDTSGLTEVQTPSEMPLSGGFVNEFHDALAVGVGAVDFFDAVAFTGSGAFGPGPVNGYSGAFADSGENDPFGFDLFNRFIVLPETYTSGALLSGSGLYSGATFESLELSPGSFSWTDDGGNNTINLTVVPEVRAYGLLLGLMGFGFMLVRRRRCWKCL